jgi:methylenetetrahydrofolate reductase (NADPH)
MANEAELLESPTATTTLRKVLLRLAQEASVEINVQDLAHLDDSRKYLPAGARIYISHLPKQAFEDTLKVCAAIKAAGFDPVPHVPVRLLESHEQFNKLAGRAGGLGVKELLLVSGDYALANGPFDNVAEVLRSIDLRSHGIERVSVGGHPEGHSKVELHEIRRAELDKARIARELGLKVTFVTQFFFESAPFLAWAGQLRSGGVSADIRAGLAGPAKITTLLRYAMRCGVGPSIKALGSRPGTFTKLLGEQGPEHLLTELAKDAIERPPPFQGIHLFCFGGYLRTCRWLHALASGEFKVAASGELIVR